jgi:hypothetical protein
MNRFVTSNDLACLLEKASQLTKLAEAGRNMAGELTRVLDRELYGAIESSFYAASFV